MTDSRWTRVASVDEVAKADGVLGRSTGGVAIALYHVDGEYFATGNICTHGQAMLSDGWFEDYVIECPLHQGLFDVRTGEVKGGPCTIPVTSFPVRREGDDLLVDLGAAGAEKG